MQTKVDVLNNLNQVHARKLPVQRKWNDKLHVFCILLNDKINILKDTRNKME